MHITAVPTATLIALDQAAMEWILDLDGEDAIDLVDLDVPLSEEEVEVLGDIRIDAVVRTRCTFQGSLEEPPEFGSFGTFRVLREGVPIGGGRVEVDDVDTHPLAFLGVR